MADTPKGPVKPPTIDLTAKQADKAPAKAPQSGPRDSTAKAGSRHRARPAAAQKPADTAEAAPKPKPETPPRPARTGLTPLLALLGGGVGGAVLGAALSLGLIYAGLGPRTETMALPPDPSPALDQMQTALDGLESRLAALSTRLDTLSAGTGETGSALTARLDQATSDLAALTSRIDALPAAPADPAPALEALRTDLSALATRLDALAAGASGTDSGELTTTLTALSQRLAALEASPAPEPPSLTPLTTRLALAETRLSELSDALDARNTVQPDTGPAPATDRLSLALMAMEAALGAGQPFEEALTALGPDREISPALAEAAKGLPAPATVTEALRTRIPAMRAAVPLPENAGWGEALLERLKALLAMRPRNPADATGPEAVLASFETALERMDLIAADAALLELPAPMQAAAGPDADDLRRLAAASKAIAALRAEGLSGAGR